jgi:hypothetical protein
MSEQDPVPEGFDRLRRRTPAAGTSGEPGRRPGRDPGLRVDPEGRASLYSVAEQPPAPATVTVECSSCEATTAVTPRQLVALAMPSVHLPVVRRNHSSWMRCPACGRRTWVRVTIRL